MPSALEPSASKTWPMTPYTAKEYQLCDRDARKLERERIQANRQWLAGEGNGGEALELVTECMRQLSYDPAKGGRSDTSRSEELNKVNLTTTGLRDS